jgi:hypothetical protein
VIELQIVERREVVMRGTVLVLDTVLVDCTVPGPD